MFTLNYKAPIWPYFSIIKNINYFYEEISTSNTERYRLDIPYEQDLNTNLSKIAVDSKERILTYYRNELLVMNTKDIAYVYIENSITHVIDINGRRSISNHSLGQLYSELDSHFFFKVNRQIILRITAIKKITKIGKGLKVDTYPPAGKLIIINKNKALAFKKWLGG